MSKSASRLGRGLSSLVETTHHTDVIDPAIVAVDAGVARVRSIPIDQITPNPRQPRAAFDEPSLAELADSIKNTGVLQPVIVRALAPDRFELVAGERRWRAARLAGLASIPAMVRELTDGQSLELALIENLQRQDLGPLERAAAYQHYLDAFGGTIEDLAKRLSESRANISNYIRLLKLRPEICFMLGRGELSMGHARAIAGVSDPQRQLAIAKLAVRRNLSVRQVEALAAGSEVGCERRDGRPTADAVAQRRHLSDVEAALSRAIGLRVEVRPSKKKTAGRVVIRFSTLEEFDRIAERIGGDARLE